MNKNSKRSFNPYFTGLPILIPRVASTNVDVAPVSILILLDYLFLFFIVGIDTPTGCVVSILILLDYLFLYINILVLSSTLLMFQSLFYWITYSYT